MVITISNSPIGDIQIMSITDTLRLGGGNIDIQNIVNHEATPRLRHAEARNGNCLIEVEDGTEYSKSITELLSLQSPVGYGKAQIDIADKNYTAYSCLITIDVIGNLGQLIKLAWVGSSIPSTPNP